MRDKWEVDPRKWGIEDFMRDAVVNLRRDGYEVHLVTDLTVDVGSEAGTMMILKAETVDTNSLGFIRVADETQLPQPSSDERTYDEAKEHAGKVVAELRRLLDGGAPMEADPE